MLSFAATDENIGKRLVILLLHEKVPGGTGKTALARFAAQLLRKWFPGSTVEISLQRRSAGRKGVEPLEPTEVMRMLLTDLGK